MMHGQITARRHHRFRSSQRDSKARSGKKWPDMKMSYFHTLLAEFAPVWLRKLMLRRWPGENSTERRQNPV